MGAGGGETNYIKCVDIKRLLHIENINSNIFRR